MPSTSNRDEQKLLAKIRAISVLVLVIAVVFIAVAVVLIPLVRPDYALSEGTLIAVFAALTTSAITFAGVTRISKDD